MAKRKHLVSPDEHTTTIAPIQFIQVGDVLDVPVPFARVTTCGGLQMEILQEVVSTDPPQGRYLRFIPEQGPLGTTTALSLLSLFTSHPDGYRAKDWLIEHLGNPYQKEEDEDWGSGMARVDNVVSKLRTLLCPVSFVHSKGIRHQVIRYLTNHHQSGPGYQLASLPLLWLDVRVITTRAEQAVRAEQQGQDAVSLWEEVVTLTGKGVYLPQEMYSDWATDMRLHVQSLGKQGVLALRRLLLARGGEANEERVLLTLRGYWHHQPTDEDVLCPLLEVLGKRGCLQEANACYQRLCALLQDEGRDPLPRTQQMMEMVLQCQGPSTSTSHPMETIITTAPPPVSRSQENDTPFSPTITPHLMDPIGEQEEEHDYHMKVSRRTAIMGFLGVLPESTQKPVDPEPWERLSRAVDKPATMSTEAFRYFQQLLECGWGLSNTGELAVAEQVISTFLPTMIQIAPYHQKAAVLAAEGLRLKGILAAHRQEIYEKLTFCLQAVECARQSGDGNILVAALTELAVAFEYIQQPHNAFKTYQEALSLANQASSLIQSRLYGRSAIAFAKEGRTEEALFYIQAAYENFPMYPEREPNFLSSDHGMYKLARHKGLLYLVMNRIEEAIKSFEFVCAHPDVFIPERSKLEILNDLGRTAILLGKLENYAECLEKGIVGATRLKSKRRFDEVMYTFQQIMPKDWVEQSEIRQIVERFQLVPV